ncbi:MAG: cytosine permease [Thermoplasmataceae archaeon]
MADAKPSNLSEGSATGSRSLFFIWFAANLTIGDFALGFIPAEEGLSPTFGIMAFVIGTLLGGILLAFMSAIGPRYRKSQMELSVGPFKRAGSRVMAILQWGNTLGWLTVNLVLSAIFLSFLAGPALEIPILLIIAAVVFLIVYFGHEAVKMLETVLSVVLAVLFVYISFRIIFGHFTTASPTLSEPFYAAFGVTLASSFSYIMSWGPYASDYSRFVAERHATGKTFLYTLLGSSISCIWIETLGMYVAIYSGNASGNPGTDLAAVTGSASFIGALALGLGGVAANAVNLYSNSNTLRTILARLSSRTAMIPGFLISIGLGFVGLRNFYGFYESFLLVLDYWITPWIGVLIAHYFLVPGKITQRSGVAFGMVSYLAGIGVSIPFMNPGVLFIGPVANLLSGMDISYFISFTISLLLYIALSRYRDKHTMQAVDA